MTMMLWYYMYAGKENCSVARIAVERKWKAKSLSACIVCRVSFRCALSFSPSIRRSVGPRASGLSSLSSPLSDVCLPVAYECASLEFNKATSSVLGAGDRRDEPVVVCS